MMTWIDFQEQATILTEQEIRRLERLIIQDYREAIKVIDAQVKEVYLKILSGVSPDEYYNTMIQYDRLNKLLTQVKLDYSKYIAKANRKIFAASQLGMSNVYYRKLFASQWLSNAKFGEIPSGLIDFTVTGIEDKWKKSYEKYGTKQDYRAKHLNLIQTMSKNRAADLQKMNDTIINGIHQGKSYTDMSKDIRKVIGLEVYKDGKLTLTGSKAKALMTVATDTNRTMNSGSYATSKHLDNIGIKVERMIISTLDNRTRPQSAAMDGQRRPIKKPFTYPSIKGRSVTSFIPGNTGVAEYDIRDREAVGDLVNGKSPKSRRGRNPETGENELFSYKDFDKWAKDNNLTKNKYGQLYIKQIK